MRRRRPSLRKRDGGPAHVRAVFGRLHGGVDVGADGAVGIADLGRRIQQRQEAVAYVDALGGAADEHGDGRCLERRLAFGGRLADLGAGDLALQLGGKRRGDGDLGSASPAREGLPA